VILISNIFWGFFRGDIKCNNFLDIFWVFLDVISFNYIWYWDQIFKSDIKCKQDLGSCRFVVLVDLSFLIFLIFLIFLKYLSGRLNIFQYSDIYFNRWIQALDFMTSDIKIKCVITGRFLRKISKISFLSKISKISIP